MTYRPWAKSARKEWLPKEGPIILMRSIPPGKPAILRPDLKNCPSVKTIKDSVEKLKIRMTSSEYDWWQEMIIQEEKRIQQWESMTPEDYRTAGESFDLMDFRYAEPAEKEEDDDAEYQERAERLLRLIDKKQNYPPVGANVTL